MSLYNGEASVVCPSVNFCANRFFSQANDRISTKLAQDGLQVNRWTCIQGVLKVKVKVKGHVIRALSWILGMSYSVIDSLVCLPHLYLTLNLKVMPLECGREIWRQKTRIMGLSHGEETMIVCRAIWAQSTSVTDGRTDRRTDGQIYDN